MGRRIDVTVSNNLLVLDPDKDFLLPFEARKGFGGGYIGLGKLVGATATLAAYTKDKNIYASWIIHNPRGKVVFDAAYPVMESIIFVLNKLKRNMQLFQAQNPPAEIHRDAVTGKLLK